MVAPLTLSSQLVCSWPNLEEQPTDDTTLRHAQIQLRQAELEAVVDALQKLSQGEAVTRYSLSAEQFDWNRLKNVETSKPIVAGHSLGGSAAVSPCSNSLYLFSETYFSLPPLPQVILIIVPLLCSIPPCNVRNST
jgi:platelet-activating factor acetylhydrolase